MGAAMTEKQWLSSVEPFKMLDFLRPEVEGDEFGDEPQQTQNALGDETSDRKLRLFACGVARHLWEKLEQAEVRSAVAFAEKLADGLIRKGRLPLLRQCAQVQRAAEQSIGFGRAGARAMYGAAGTAYDDALGAAQIAVREGVSTGLRKKGVASVIREVFGNPFRPVAFSPAWRTDTAVSLARQMYESRDFSAMPILADALQDAGCEDATILDHCRGAGPHVRGCWAVDLVLGKE